MVLALDAISRGCNALNGLLASSLLSSLFGLISILTGLAILIGFVTPVAGAASAFGYFAVGVSKLLAIETYMHSNNALMAWNLSAVSIALVLLGPGAFSLDARLFGRREIILP